MRSFVISISKVSGSPLCLSLTFSMLRMMFFKIVNIYIKDGIDCNLPVLGTTKWKGCVKKNCPGKRFFWFFITYTSIHLFLIK